ncbi:MAG TPA: hypothetical protein VFW77_04150 [Candidatus Saccharimonadales bacterium]|nr:hypothetical protein [Candidatus Saccharimonadales bacterium]
MNYVSRSDIERGKAERRAREADVRAVADRRMNERLAGATRWNRHNFAQLQAAGFPEVAPIEILSWTGNMKVARFLERFLRYDVEYGVDGGRHQLVRRRRMQGYLMPATYGNTQDWNGSPPTIYDAGLALTTEGEVHPVHRDAREERGCLIVNVVDMYPTLGTVDSPATLPREFPYHLYELTAQVLHDAGLEYRPIAGPTGTPPGN